VEVTGPGWQQGSGLQPVRKNEETDAGDACRIDALLFDLQDVGARPYTYLGRSNFAWKRAWRRNTFWC